MYNALRVLCLEDDPGDVALISHVLKEEGEDIEMLVVADGDAYAEALRAFLPNVVLCDCQLGAIGCEQALGLLREVSTDIPFIIVTSFVSEQQGLDAVKAGVDAYVFKDRIRTLPVAIYNALEKAKLRREYEQLQAELLRRERRYCTLIEHAKDAIFLVNEKAEIVYQSPSARALTGFVINDLLFKRTLEFVHPEDVEQCKALIRAVMARPGIAITEEFRILHKDGGCLWMEGAVTNLLHDESVGAFMVYCRDITEQKLAEKKLIDVNRLFAFISQVNQMIVSVADEQTMFDRICEIATGVGNFRAAWVEQIDNDEQHADVVAAVGISKNHIQAYINGAFESNPIRRQVQEADAYYVCNNVQEMTVYSIATLFTPDEQYGSYIALPIKRDGVIVGSFNLMAGDTNFFNDDEIALLEETAGDVSFALDVFEKDRQRTRAVNQLKYSESRLMQAQSIAHVGNWELNNQTGVAMWSDEALRIYGLPEGENVQSYDTWISAIHPDDLDYVLEISRDAERTLGNIEMFHRIVRKDGTVRFLHSHACYEVDDNGKPIGRYGAFVDITELKEAEDALRASELRYSSIFRMSAQPMWVYDSETLRFVQVNKAAVDNYGYSEQEFLSMTIRDIRPKEEMGKLIAHIDRVEASDQSVFNGRHRHTKKSGEIIDVDIYGSSITLSEKVCRLIIAIDITEKIQFENKVTQAIIKAQEDERYEIGEELHDNVCQILASGQLSLAMMRKWIMQDGQKWYDECRSYIRLASKEIRNLSHHLAPAFFEDITLEDGVKNLLKTFEYSNKYDISFYFDPLLHKYPLVRDIQLNLYRIIQEQLRNILKHSGATAFEVDIRLENDSLIVRISDNGRGCDIGTIKRGIGLANMKRRAELFYGKFDFESMPGKGFEIRANIPMSENNLSSVELPYDQLMRSKID